MLIIIAQAFHSIPAVPRTETGDRVLVLGEFGRERADGKGGCVSWHGEEQRVVVLDGGEM